VHQNRDNELPTEIKIPEEFDWVKEVGAHRCGATISSRFQDLAERTKRGQKAILTRELRSEWQRLGRINCRCKGLKTSKVVVRLGRVVPGGGGGGDGLGALAPVICGPIWASAVAPFFVKARWNSTGWNSVQHVSRTVFK